jgi:adenine-specific DNA-methyltransferase
VEQEGKKVTVRVDGFSDRPDNPLAAPDFLFFGAETEVDLNADYGTRNKRYKVRPLIEIFQRYKFTIEENTPVEEEVALDPELLGKVFENLLAAYNPETGATARKQTGSFYTPREIVNYMVDEALIAYLESQLLAELPGRPSLVETTPASQSTLFGEAPPVQGALAVTTSAPGETERQELNARLRRLFAYEPMPHAFAPAEVERLIAAIDRVKILDPACGSGACPMGVLHRLVFILGRLDPDNARWRAAQRRRALEETAQAFAIGERSERQRRLLEIEEVFERNSSDYGRKLYLIENCIYGVDIQPIAVQIAKLRFFISLIVDQKASPPQVGEGLGGGVQPGEGPGVGSNLGIRPNTLLDIERPAGQSFGGLLVAEKEKELAEVRRRHFIARTPATKEKYRQEDARLRQAIAGLLKASGWRDESAERLAAWNPYDQNAAADFFDPAWMFGVDEGFDVVIGNPPYVRQEEIRSLKPLLQPRYSTYTGTADLYVYFYERALQLLRPNGVLSFISSNKYFRAG